MPEFFSFFLIIGIGLLFSEVFYRLKLPYVSALLIAGLVLGPLGFGVITLDPTLEFIAEIGLIFLMFMAGVEINPRSLREDTRSIVILAGLSGLIPFLAGFLLGVFLELSLLGSFVLAAVFLASSVAVVIPTIEGLELTGKRLGKLIISSTVVNDIASLFLVAVVLQQTNPIRDIPLWLYIPTLVLIVWVLSKVEDRVGSLFLDRWKHISKYEREIRFVLATLFATVILFEAIGIHAIIAGFVAGLILFNETHDHQLLGKIHVLAYGLFIPFFFLLLGAQTDFTAFASGFDAFNLIFIVCAVAIISKFIAGFVGGKVLGFTNREAALLGSAIIPHLSSSLVVAFIAVSAGIFGEDMVAAIIILSLVTTILSPFLVQLFGKKFAKDALLVVPHKRFGK